MSSFNPPTHKHSRSCSSHTQGYTRFYWNMSIQKKKGIHKINASLSHRFYGFLIFVFMTLCFSTIMYEAVSVFLLQYNRSTNFLLMRQIIKSIKVPFQAKSYPNPYIFPEQYRWSTFYFDQAILGTSKLPNRSWLAKIIFSQMKHLTFIFIPAIRSWYKLEICELLNASDIINHPYVNGARQTKMNLTHKVLRASTLVGERYTQKWHKISVLCPTLSKHLLCMHFNLVVPHFCPL